MFSLTIHNSHKTLDLKKNMIFQKKINLGKTITNLGGNFIKIGGLFIKKRVDQYIR